MSWLRALLGLAAATAIARELVYVTWAQADRMLRDPSGGWSLAPEEDRNRVLGMAYLERRRPPADRMSAINPAAAHRCHWPGCSALVPPERWGCQPHWYALPAELRRRLWSTYRTGQEISKTPSLEYLAAARAAQDWIQAHAAELRSLMVEP
ncbi:MAG TPA: hypothetical protein VGF89_01115 [Steroidobacteraceae bacterium]